MHHAWTSLSLIGGPESGRCDIGSTAHNSSRHLLCLISFLIAAPPLHRPNLIVETDFAITDTASTSPRADITHLLSLSAQMPRPALVLSN
jgi:hypothetical protein